MAVRLPRQRTAGEFIGKAGAQTLSAFATRPSGSRIRTATESAPASYTLLRWGCRQVGLEDADLQAACFKAYNDWTAEFCSYDQRRFIGMALISLADIELGARELRRAAKIGLRGAMIWGAPPPDKPFWHPVYDPFWTAAQELEMPLSLHVITGGPKTSPLRIRSRAAGVPPADEGVRPPDRLHDLAGGGAGLLF